MNKPTAVFTATKFDTAEDKRRFADKFVKFVESNFDQREFPMWFYRKLINTFGMIAHYDRSGFYAEYFESGSGKVRFIRECLAYPCYGDPAYTYSDVEKWLIAWMRGERILTKLQARSN